MTTTHPTPTAPDAGHAAETMTVTINQPTTEDNRIDGILRDVLFDHDQVREKGGYLGTSERVADLRQRLLDHGFTIAQPTAPARLDGMETEMDLRFDALIIPENPSTVERVVWMQDTEFGDALLLLQRGDTYALITTDMESGAARYFHAVVRFPKDGEWERIEGDEGITAFYAAEEARDDA